MFTQRLYQYIEHRQDPAIIRVTWKVVDVYLERNFQYISALIKSTAYTPTLFELSLCRRFPVVVTLNDEFQMLARAVLDPKNGSVPNQFNFLSRGFTSQRLHRSLHSSLTIYIAGFDKDRLTQRQKGDNE